MEAMMISYEESAGIKGINASCILQVMNQPQAAQPGDSIGSDNDSETSGNYDAKDLASGATEIPSVSSAQRNQQRSQRTNYHSRQTVSPSLNYLTRAGDNYDSFCSTRDLVYIFNNISSSSTLPTDTKFNIPKQVHQTSKSRCVTPLIAQLIKTWKLGEDWSYYFHDDDAMARLFALDWSHVFPHLKQVLNCISNRGTLLADIWRYLILYEYGGIYVDIDSVPTKFNSTTIQPNDQGFFVVEQYHLLSQYFMAMTPKHPLMYYAIHASMLHILESPDTGMIQAPAVTGPHALHKGFVHYRMDVGVHVPLFGPGEKCVWKGVFAGTDNTTIRVEGKGENENEYVRREAITRGHKRKEYDMLNMTHFSDNLKPSGHSCLAVLYHAKEDSRRRLLEVM